MSTTVKIEKVGPKQAQAMLEGNTQNRGLRQRVVTAYARDMMSGRWAEQGDPIRMNGDGTLLDGQHRLHAIIESKTTQSMVIVRGVSKSSILTMDTGARRSMADVLKLQGYTHVTALAAATRFLMLYERGQDVRYKESFTHSEMMDWLTAHDDVPSHVGKISNVGHPYIKRIRTPLIGIRHHAKDRSEADTFADMIRTGADLSEGNPIHTLRRTLENLTMSKQTRVVPVVLHAVTVKAWNAWLSGESSSVLRFKPGGDQPEKFPTILAEG